MTWTRPPNGELDEHPESLPLFLYGTLRVGAEAHSRLARIIVGDPEPASVRGELRRHVDGDWPVLIAGEGLVVGEVVSVRAGAELWELLCSYELAWGYSLMWLPRADNPGRVLACVWEWEEGRGALIASGDWLHPG